MLFSLVWFANNCKSCFFLLLLLFFQKNASAHAYWMDLYYNISCLGKPITRIAQNNSWFHVKNHVCLREKFREWYDIFGVHWVWVCVQLFLVTENYHWWTWTMRAKTINKWINKCCTYECIHSEYFFVTLLTSDACKSNVISSRCKHHFYKYNLGTADKCSRTHTLISFRECGKQCSVASKELVQWKIMPHKNTDFVAARVQMLNVDKWIPQRAQMQLISAKFILVFIDGIPKKCFHESDATFRSFWL